MHPISSSTSHSLLSRAEIPHAEPLPRFPFFSNQSFAPSLGGRSQICETISQALSSLCQRIKRLVDRIFSLFSSSTSFTPSATTSSTSQEQLTATSTCPSRTSSTVVATTSSPSESTSIAQRAVPVERLFGEPLNFSESPERFAAIVALCNHFSSCYTHVINLSTEISRLISVHHFIDQHLHNSSPTIPTELLNALRIFVRESEALQNAQTCNIHFSICGQGQAQLVRDLKSALHSTFPDLSDNLFDVDASDSLTRTWAYCNCFLRDYAHVERQRGQIGADRNGIGAEYINSLLIDLLVAEKAWRRELSTWLENNPTNSPERQAARAYERFSSTFAQDLSSSIRPEEQNPFSWITITAYHNKQRTLLEQLRQAVGDQNRTSSTSTGTSENPVAALIEPLRNYFYILEEFFYHFARARLPDDQVLRERVTSFVQYDFQTVHVMQSYQRLLQQIAPHLPAMRENHIIDRDDFNTLTEFTREMEDLLPNRPIKSLFSDFAFWNDVNVGIATNSSPSLSPVRTALTTFLENANAFCALHYGMIELVPSTSRQDTRDGTFFFQRGLRFVRPAILYSNWHHLHLFYEQLLSNPSENNSLFSSLSTQTINALRASYQRAREQYGFETFPYPEDLRQLDLHVDSAALFRTTRQPFYAALIESLNAIVEQNPALQELTRTPRGYTSYGTQPRDLVDIRHMLTTVQNAMTVPGSVGVTVPLAP